VLFRWLVPDLSTTAKEVLLAQERGEQT